MPILCKSFNGIVRFFGSQVPHSLATSQYADFAEMKTDFERTGRIKINVDNCDNSIFGSATDNYLFRAWHDSCHLRVNGAFDRDGEIAASECMIADVLAHTGISERRKLIYCALIDSEVRGQVNYYLEHGTFPPNAYEWTLANLSDAVIELIDTENIETSILPVGIY